MTCQNVVTTAPESAEDEKCSLLGPCMTMRVVIGSVIGVIRCRWLSPLRGLPRKPRNRDNNKNGQDRTYN